MDYNNFFAPKELKNCKKLTKNRCLMIILQTIEWTDARTRDALSQ